MNTCHGGNPSTVYGPVYSWRFGRSIGIDPIALTSSCSFHCIYCQLGCIEKPLVKRRIFVPTEQVEKDFANVTDARSEFDVVTFSGSGEPTLASNIGQMCTAIKSRCSGKQMILLTNGTLLFHKNIHKELSHFDHIVVKFDAGDAQTWMRMNRPLSCLDFQEHLHGIEDFRTNFAGIFSLQIMLLPVNINSIMNAIPLFQDLSPAHIYLCAPTRPVPTEWKLRYRGDHSCEPAKTYDKLRRAGDAEVNQLVSTLQSETNAKIHLAPRPLSSLRKTSDTTIKDVATYDSKKQHAQMGMQQ